MRIGLTGGIGSGKSTVARILVEAGAHLIDTDAIAHALTAPGGAAIPAIRAAFGDEFIDPGGALDRRRMRERVFTEPAARERLQALLHPLITQIALADAATAETASPPPPCVVFDVPLLVESGHWRERVDKVLVVDCEETTQVERVSQRPGWSAERARAVIAAQASRAARHAAADAVIYNDGISVAALRTQVLDLLRSWGAL
ncbi:dephospho-CoA kinase [Roseateles paludis]|uniref:Dephospho-CoA kinase n=1 Tax=Roseateles paludis TaxID=3145238 RepID=A0ABV0G4G2_9BURK